MDTDRVITVSLALCPLLNLTSPHGFVTARVCLLLPSPFPSTLLQFGHLYSLFSVSRSLFLLRAFVRFDFSTPHMSEIIGYLSFSV